MGNRRIRWRRPGHKAAAAKARARLTPPGAQAAVETLANRGTGGGSYSSALRAGHVMQPQASSHTQSPVALRT